MKFTIDIDEDEIKLIAGKADKILVDREIEPELAKLLEYQVKLEETISAINKLIEEKALKMNPNFKSVEGDLIKASYRAYGQKYYLEDDKIGEVAPEMFTKEIVTKYKVNTDIVDTWIEKNGGLPFGISAPVRVKSLKIALKKKNATT